MGVASSGDLRQVVQAKWDQVEVYGHDRRSQYKHIRTSRLGKMRGDMATVEEGTPGTKKVYSVAPPPICSIPPTDFLDVLRGWGQTWIWDDLTVTGGTDWFAQAIADNSLVAVTNRSYIKEHYPKLCAAAFVLECMAVTDGSYIKEHYLELCAAAFVLECTKGRG